MKAVILGGAGVEGSYAVECLSGTDVFSEILIADVAEERARELCAGEEKVEYEIVDVTDKESLTNTLKDADVAVNCIGPFYKFAPLVLEAAIDAGVDVVDICDDYDVTRKLIEDYNEDAEDAGVTCVIGLGSSPGLTNIIARLASEQLSEVDDINIYVTRGLGEESGGAIPYHMFHSWLGKVPVYKDGEYEMAQGLVDGKKYVNFPEPFGQTPVYYFGHPETITLPRYIEGVNNVACRGVFFPNEFRDALLQVKSLGFLSEEPIKIEDREITPLDFSANHLESLIEIVTSKSEDVPTGGSIMIEVSGKENSTPKTYRYEGTALMKQGTATPVSIGAEMMAEGEIDSPGVKGPEACVEPEEFMGRLMGKEGFGDVWLTVREKITGETLEKL